MKSKKGEGVYNVVVIGAGTAGLVTAAGTASLGGRVALIERNKMGGDCLNFGCVPSKALISSARLAHHIAHAEEWGLSAQAPRFELAHVFERMRERRAEIAPNDSQARFESLGVDVFRGQARFLSPREVEVDGTTLRAKNFVIATGTRATIPPIEGLEAVRYFTNETIFDELTASPESMLVIGGGPIGCELSQAFARLGVKVTLLNRGRQILSKEDADVAELIAARLTADGVTILAEAEAKSCQQKNGTIELRYELKSSGDEQHSIKAEALLIAAGRTPNLDSLHLQTARVKYNTHGIVTNERLQTSQPHIYAIGDVVGPYQFTHMADYHARIVVRNILVPFAFLGQKIDYSVVPWCTFVDPEVARVGLNEREAAKQKIAFDVIRQEMAQVDRAVVESEETGFAKVLVKRGTDEILGATIVSEHAGELIHEFILAMQQGIGLGKIASMIHVYPTFAEVARKVGDQFNKKRLTPLARKIFGWLYERGRS
ncbi:MAG: mercuric reductase [Verrucomicrobiota bacterium]|nr:mercuric reductase [Verrucomicrobiota bacterium]